MTHPRSGHPAPAKRDEPQQSRRHTKADDHSRREDEARAALDQALEDSFPASDPPSSTAPGSQHH